MLREATFASIWAYGTPKSNLRLSRKHLFALHGRCCCVYRQASTSNRYFHSRRRTNALYSRTHLYDGLSRPTAVTLSINGKTYPYTRSYNSDSRLATLSYPSGLVVQYVYTSLGYLAQLQDNATGAVLWTANARDAEMHLTDQQAGNGVDTIQVFDPNTGLVQQIRASGDGSDDGSTANLSTQFDRIGNLKNRSDNYGATENFCYDKLNRLINYASGGPTCLMGTPTLVGSSGSEPVMLISPPSPCAIWS